MINADLDYVHLDKELDRVKTRVFLGNNAAFLGSIMCSMNFMWTSDIKTAQTNGFRLQWNPYWFLKIPFETRVTVLVHELWHVALLHMLRRGERDPKIWNYACDIAINNMLENEGYTFEGTRPWLDQKYGTKPAEEIYDDLIGMPVISIYGLNLWGHEDDDGVGDTEDIVEPDEGDTNGQGNFPIINTVVHASHVAKLAGESTEGGAPGEVQSVLKRFLQPKLPWEQLLFNFFNELAQEDYTWMVRDRRYSHVYLPSLMEDENGLEHLIYYLDVSGSVSDAEVIRFNSEVKYIKEQLKPKKLTLVLFDDRIQREYVFEEEDVFEEVVVVGRGGTSLGPVRDHMLEHKPTAAVVFSDLDCAPMQPLPAGEDIPVIWIAVNNTGAVVNFGKLVHIRE